jgi:prepilin-type processing-associated H-X9-DG protein
MAASEAHASVPLYRSLTIHPIINSACAGKENEMNDDEKRINIEDLPKAAEELSDAEEKGVTGGHSGGINVVMGDGSVRQSSGGTLNANKVITIGGSRTEDV